MAADSEVLAAMSAAKKEWERPSDCPVEDGPTVSLSCPLTVCFREPSYLELNECAFYYRFPFSD